MRRGTVAFATLVFCVWAGLVAVHAEEPNADAEVSPMDLVKALTDLQSEKTTELNAIQPEEDAVARASKEYHAYDPDFQPGGFIKDQRDWMEKQRSALETRLGRFNDEFSRLKASEADFNRTCVGRMPRERYNVCAQRKADFESWDRAMLGRKQALESDMAQFLDKKKQIDRKINEVEARRSALEAEMKEAAARAEAHRAALAEAERRIEAVIAKLRSTCSLATSDEKLKYCHSINWDNAQKGLPPL